MKLYIYLKRYFCLLFILSAIILFVSCKTPITIIVIKRPSIIIDTSKVLLLGDFISYNDSIDELNQLIKRTFLSLFQGSKFKEIYDLNDIIQYRGPLIQKNLNKIPEKLCDQIKQKYPEALILNGNVKFNLLTRLESYDKAKQGIYTPILHNLCIQFNFIDVKQNTVVIKKDVNYTSGGKLFDIGSIYNDNCIQVLNDFARLFVPFDTIVKLNFCKNPDLLGVDHVISYLKEGKIEKAEELLKKMAEVEYKSSGTKCKALYNYGIFLDYNGNSQESIKILKSGLQINPSNLKILGALEIAKKNLYLKIKPPLSLYNI